MTVEDPNILKKLKEIEDRLAKIEERISDLEQSLGGFPSRSPPQPDPIHPPTRPGPQAPEPFKF